jgi:hypothetical protein
MGQRDDQTNAQSDQLCRVWLYQVDQNSSALLQNKAGNFVEANAKSGGAALADTKLGPDVRTIFDKMTKNFSLLVVLSSVQHTSPAAS